MTKQQKTGNDAVRNESISEFVRQSQFKKDKSFDFVETKLSINRGDSKIAETEHLDPNKLNEENLHERLNEFFGDEIAKRQDEEAHTGLNPSEKRKVLIAVLTSLLMIQTLF